MRYQLSVVFLILFSSVFAHSGGTDSKGGHHDRINGGYHYHHGKPAHSHQNGCPYKDESIKKTKSKPVKDGIFGMPKMVYWTSFIIIILISLFYFILDHTIFYSFVRAFNKSIFIDFSISRQTIY